MVEIRQCRQDDFGPVLRLLEQLWPDRELDRGRMEEAYLHGLDSDSQVYLCAMMDGEPVAFCSLAIKNSLWQQGYLANVDELVVDERLRRKGIGGELLERVLQIAVEKGCHRVELDSAFRRQDAHRFYEAHGFKSRSLLFTKEI